MQTVAAVYGVSYDALRRHKANHLLPETRERLATDEELADVDVLAEMRALYRRMLAFLERAEEADAWPAVRAFHAEARRDLELLAKLVGDLDERPQVNVVIAPRVQEAILNALAPYPEARIAVADALEEIEG
ncbi:MAG: hypothetical protein M3P49_08040 [Actinomycetota bacterium]|nr:hypothetical protein [Actinomycetota bacterium]